jgi:DNA topoisomerase-2
MAQESSSFKRLTDVEHVKLRSAMYIGSCTTTSVVQWTLDPLTQKAERKLIDYNPGLDQLANETSTNAYDNIPRSIKAGIAPGRIEYTITKRVVSVYNEGLGIPVEIHPLEGIYTPEMIFFILRTSSNYDDTADRTWCGVNGIGIKATAIMSLWMEIEIADPKRKLLYKQRCEKNLSVLFPPEITPYTGGKAYTRVTYEADFDRFEVKEYSDDMIKVCAFNAASASFNTKVPIAFNGVDFAFDSIEKFARLFAEKIDNHLIYKDEHVELCLMDTPETAFQLGYVNTLLCKRGGVHVNETLKLFSATILEKLNKKKKLFDIRDVKKHLSLIVSCTVSNPVFSGQTKDELVKPTPKIDIPASTLRKIEKWSFVRQMSLYADLKMQNGNEKEKKTKSVHVTDIPDYECANNAGRAESHKCMLIVTEGLSAKTFALRYRDCFPNGADWIGVLPMRGKGLNVRNATGTQLVGNKELIAIRKVLNLRPGTDYTDPVKQKELRYGSVMIATDADADGDHITGLHINLVGYSYKSLTEIGFLKGLLTPILSAEKGKEIKYFLTKAEFHTWYDVLPDQSKWEIQYYKGLGRWQKEHFKDHSKFVQITYKFDAKAEASLKLAFDKTFADARKDWVSNVNPEPPLYVRQPDQTLSQEVTNFINTRLILFSIEDNLRSIPSIVDNFKPSQRKIFYATRKKRLADKPIKIAQFMGYVAEQTAYEHGEGNLGDTIMNMCQDFLPGS